MVKKHDHYTRTKPHNTITDVQVEAFKILYPAGMKKMRIARALGLSTRHVYRLIEKYFPGEPRNDE